MSSKKITQLKDRIKFVREYKNLKKSEFADLLGISRPYITELESGGKDKISSLLAMSIENKFGFDKDWLLTGEGGMFLKKQDKSEYDKIFYNEFKKDIKLIPVIDTRISAGYPDIANKDNISDYIFLSGISNNAIAITVKGKSMYPKIKEGAYVIFLPVEYTDNIKHNDIVIASDEWNDLMVKRYKEINGEKYLTSDNPEYPTFKPNGNYKIIGKVIKIIYEENP